MLMTKATVFNSENTGYLTGDYPLFLGQRLGLYDSIYVAYPKLLDFYKLQRSLRWTEDEVNLEQSRLDLLPMGRGGKSNPEEIDLMVKNLALLWELDSVASRSIIALLAPFISNSEMTALATEWSAMEIIHALTYSEILRQCVPDTKRAVEEVVKNDEVLGRSELIINTFDNLARAGAEYNAGRIKDSPELKAIIFKGMVGLYLLERVQFMSSFATIFAFAESGRCIGIAKLVQLICRDELAHARFSSTIIGILRSNPEWAEVFEDIKPELNKMLEEVMQREFKWNSYLFSEGRKIIGLNELLLNEWVLHCALDLATDLDLDFKWQRVEELPIRWMDNWIDFDKTQNANQEVDNTSYRMNMVADDVDDEIFDI